LVSALDVPGVIASSVMGFCSEADKTVKPEILVLVVGILFVALRLLKL
jgi:hypothetical protein